MKKFVALLLSLISIVNPAFAGLNIVRSNGITLTGADGITLTGADGITLTGADGFLNYTANGITLTGADGITLTGADGITLTGADGASYAGPNGITLTGADGITLTGADGITLTGADGAAYAGPNGITLTGADGITLTGADGITLTGADGITLTGADGTQYRADSIVVRRPDGITLTGADGITLTGADGITLTGADGATRVGLNGITLTGADGITLTGADGITLTGADGITLTGADSVTGFGTSGVIFDHTNPSGITLTGADGITLTGADGITLTGADGITLTGADGITLTGADDQAGLQSVDPELAIALNNATDDSSINAVVVYHRSVTESDLEQLRQIGIQGGTRFRSLPMVYVTGTRDQILAISRLRSVRSLYGNRTLTFDSDPYFAKTGIQRVAADAELRADNGGLPISGRNVTVAVLDTGINGSHPDLAGKVVQNVRLADTQSLPIGFMYPTPVEGMANSDLAGGHGTFVSGIIAGSGASSNGKFAGVAPNAKLLGLSAGDVNLTNILSGFDYLMQKGSTYGVRVVNCSFSASTLFDPNDPVNVATKMLSDAAVVVVFSAGNTGAGNGTLNPYAAAPWVISVGATDEKGILASFSSRGNFGDPLQHPSLVAPGVNVASLRNIGTSTGTAGIAGADAQRLSALELPYYTTASGTSFSAPQVAGAAALMLEANPNLKPAEIKNILSRTSTPLPKYFYHEAGAGMLNAHAAVLEAAFPEREMGAFRSTISKNEIRFTTVNGQAFQRTVLPGTTESVPLTIPQNTVQATVNISWGIGVNDFGLKLFGSNGKLIGESNYLNVTGLTGRREKVVAQSPPAQIARAAIQHTGGVGVVQNVIGSMQVTTVDFPNLRDLESLASDSLLNAEQSLLRSIILPEGSKFKPDSTVSRSDFAATLLRAGLVSQFMAAQPVYTDVRDPSTRSIVESVQAGPSGQLIFDAAPGSRFYPNNNVTRLVAAIAFVRAAGLEASAATAALPPTVADSLTIPSQYRGHVAVALQQGFLSLDGNRFNAGRAITRIELSRSTNALIGR
jgi:serine protease AprX